MTSAADSSRQQRKSLARRWAIAAWRDLDSDKRSGTRVTIALVVYFTAWVCVGGAHGLETEGPLRAIAGGCLGFAAGFVVLVVLAVGSESYDAFRGWATDLRVATDEID